MTQNLLQRLEEKYPSLSKSHKKIANYIHENYDKAAFMTAAKLGAAVSISESTVVRFATGLGFEGYPELQHAMQEMIRNKLTAIQRMEVTSLRLGERDVITTQLLEDIASIRETMEKTSKEDFKQSVARINHARKIYILGVRSASFLAQFLAYYLKMIYENVILVDTASETGIFEQTFRIDERDVCIAISFPRYSKQIINALHFIHDRGASIVAITDSEHSPIASYAQHILVARSNIASVVDSLVAPLSLINALIVALSMSQKNEVAGNFDLLEKIWEQYDVYEKSEGDKTHDL